MRKGLRRTLGSFGRDEGGSVAVVAGLTFLLAVTIALGQIDITRAMLAKQMLQDAVDAATLAAARSEGTSKADLQDVGSRFANAQLLDNNNLKNVALDFVPGPHSVIGKARADVQPIFLQAILNGPMQVSVETEVERGVTSSLELALVLDTTYSMTGSRLTALKGAANEMVDELTKEKKADVRIALVPFGQYVNVGVSARKEPWVGGVPNDYTDTKTTNTAAGCRSVPSTTTCATPGQAYSCTKYNDGVPYQTTCYTAASNCTTVTHNPPLQQCWPASSSTSTTQYKFYGCVGSPAYPKNVRDNDPGRVYPGMWNTTCGSEMMPLSNKVAQLKAKIDSLAASGETYIPAGLAWGYNALSKPLPLTDAAEYDLVGPNKRPRKALVLMTDGANTKTMQAGGGHHNNGAGPQANQYTRELCDNIKDSKIELYTVAFEVNDSVAKALLQQCASDQSHYFDAANAEDLKTAFASISASLRDIWISH